MARSTATKRTATKRTLTAGNGRRPIAPVSDAGPPFPLDVLPLALRRMAIAAADRVGVHRDAAACVALGVVAVLCCQRVTVSGAYDEPVNVYLAIGMGSGERKSGIFSVLETEARRLLVAGDRLVDDITPAALPGVLERTGGRAVMIGPETSLLLNAERFEDQGIVALLKGFSGEVHTVDRVVTGRTSVEVNLALAVATQLGPFRAFVRNDMLEERGLIGRMLVAAPPSVAGSRPFSKPAVPDTVAEAWAGLLQAIHERVENGAVTLRFSDDALEAFRAEYETIEPMRRPGHPWSVSLGAWASRWESHVQRMAAVIQLATDPNSLEIDVESLRAAIAVVTYFAGHLRKLRGTEAASTAAIRKVLAKIQDGGHQTVTKREANSWLRSRTDRAADVDPVLQTLVAHGILEPFPPPPPNARGGRPPSPGFEVNPQVHLTDLDELVRS